MVGHELTHGFDDQGRKFDAQGNLRDWWTKEDAVEFEKRAQCLIDEYSRFETIPGVHLNGKLTLGENTADNGGVRLAFMALMDSLNGKPGTVIDGYTPAQRLFSVSARSGVRTKRRKARACWPRPIRTRPGNSAPTASFRTCLSFRRPSPASWTSPWWPRLPAGSGNSGIDQD